MLRRFVAGVYLSESTKEMGLRPMLSAMPYIYKNTKNKVGGGDSAGN